MGIFRKLAIVEPGEYQVKVTSARSELSKSGNEMISLRLCVEGGASEFFEHLVFTGSGYWKIEQFLTAMGEEGIDGTEIEASDYTRRTARALVGVEDFKGRPQNKIVKWLPPKSAAVVAAEAAALTQSVSSEAVDEQEVSR